MATPIKDTPVLTGKDARYFAAWLKNNEGKKISQEDRSRIIAAGKKIKVLSSMKEYERSRAGTFGS